MRTYSRFYKAAKAEARRRARKGDRAAQAALERKDVSGIEAIGRDLEAQGLLFLRERNGVVRTREWVRVDPTDWWLRRYGRWTGPFPNKGAAVARANEENAAGPAPVRRIEAGHYRHAVSNDVIRDDVARAKGMEPRVERDG